MDLIDVGSIVSAVQGVKDEQERESWLIFLACNAVNSIIIFNYSLGRGLQLKSPILKWMGYCFTHLAAMWYKTAMQQTFTKRLIVAAPKELTTNNGLLDSIHVEQITNKKTS